MKLSHQNKSNIKNMWKLLDKDWQKLLVKADKQDWKLSSSKKGIRLASPNGDHLVFIHLTPTKNNRALANKISELRRAGLKV